MYNKLLMHSMDDETLDDFIVEIGKRIEEVNKSENGAIGNLEFLLLLAKEVKNEKKRKGEKENE